MKTAILTIPLVLTFATSGAGQSSGDKFVNFIRQVQLPDGVVRDVDVEAEGQEYSALEINPGGARFELHTVNADLNESFLLDSKYVGSYVPVAEVLIRSEDPHTPIPRTRADRPFQVTITTNGLLDGPDDPEASKSVDVFHHVQSYGADGDGVNVDRTQATLIGQGSLGDNGEHVLTYEVSAVPGADRSKLRGEERLSVYSLPDYQAPASKLDSQFIQIWPVADGSISGIETGQSIRFSVPQITVAVNDIYPDSRVYAQLYQGEKADNVDGVIVPGSAKIYEESVPQSLVRVLDDWDKVIDADGTWTMELLTATPFGIDRLDHVTFNINRTIEVNSGVTTVE